MVESFQLVLIGVDPMPAATSDLVPHHIARLCACGAKL